MTNVAAFIVFLLFSIQASATAFSSECTSFSKPLNGGYCIHTPKGRASNDVIYHLHGRGGSQYTWQDQWYYTQQIRNQWNQQNAKPPIVVSISLGPEWILAEKNQSPYSGFFELMTQKVIPDIESQLGGLNGKRILLGESMGGLNSVQLSLKTKLFDKAAILCAPMSEISPFAPHGEILEHARKSSAWQYYGDNGEQAPEEILQSIGVMTELARSFFVNQENWERADPLLLAKDARGTKTKFYIAVGFYDHFAAYEGNEIFSNTLKSQGATVDWRPQWGGHCAIDIPSLASFLVN